MNPAASRFIRSPWMFVLWTAVWMGVGVLDGVGVLTGHDQPASTDLLCKPLNHAGSRRLAESNRCCDPRNQTVADQKGFVYVVETEDALKIGWSRQPIKRFDQLERQTGGYVHVWMCEPGTLEDERRAQAYWAHLRIRGVDWFQVDDELIAAAERGCLVSVRVGLLRFARRRMPQGEVSATDPGGGG